MVEEATGTRGSEKKNKKRQQKLSKKLCLSAVSSLTVACLDRSARLAFYARPKRRWINTDVCNSTGWCCASRQPRTERGKKKKQKKVCALGATISKNTLPTSSAQLPFSRWRMRFFLEFSVLFFSILTLINLYSSHKKILIRHFILKMILIKTPLSLYREIH